MFRFIIRKLAYGFLVLLGVVCAVFFLFMALPGDPAMLTMGQRTDLGSLDAVNKELGLDKPKPVQFILYLNDISPLSVHFNSNQNQEKYNYTSLLSFGERVVVFKFPYLRKSYQTQKSVTAIIATALPNTVVLAFAAIIFAIIIGIFLGTVAAVAHQTWLDSSVLFVSVLGISVPSFFSAILFQWVFAFVLSSFTGLSMTGSFFMPDIFGVTHLMWGNLVLPAITLGLRPVAIITQLTRSSMLDVLSQDYVRTARAKGLGYTKVVFKHALRNALNPVLTAVSGWFAEMLAGAFFIEMIFGWNGIGKLTVEALNKNDFPVLMGSVLFAASIFVAINILVDILYGVFDPRIARK